MKQILQNIKNGETLTEQVPVPAYSENELLIRSRTSLISTGTERMIVDFGKASLLQKARQQPDKVKMVLDKVRTDGIVSTFEAVSSKLMAELPLGYANVGSVESLGSEVQNFSLGDRVLSNGFHAEFVAVGKNLCVRVPDSVSDDDAAFAVPGAIALQGVRLGQPTLGECFVVVGLGLIGLIAVQILRANGCRVLGLDIDSAKFKLAEEYGAIVEHAGSEENILRRAEEFSRGRGVDGVIITASAKGNEIVHQAATMCRQRGRIVLVGVVGLDLQRSDFYEKELSFQVSCSYGPGRYDPLYEDSGNDYPVGFVRWTEQRNFEAVLDMLASGDLSVGELVSARFGIDNARAAYDRLSSDRSCLGILLKYDEPSSGGDGRCTVQIAAASLSARTPSEPGALVLGALGAGNYARRVLLPAFQKAGVSLDTIVTTRGVSGTQVGKKLGFDLSATDPDSIFGSSTINTVVVATRHDSHAKYVMRAIEDSKHVFVEKPLALSLHDLDEIERAYIEKLEKPIVMVGFNRRFAPLVQQVKSCVGELADPMNIILNCNAGHIDRNSWVQDAVKGGGRIVGEACHFIDLARFLADSEIVGISAAPMRSAVAPSGGYDTACITIRFRSGSLAAVNYFASGHRSYPKERIEVHQANRTFVLENYRILRSYGVSRKKLSRFRADRGQGACVQAFVDAVKTGGQSPIPFDQVLEVSRFSLLAAEQIRR